jgi:predicted transposase/invertase (TIGR01784 family)
MPILPHDIEILSPIDDHIFKTLLTHPDAKPSLMSIISAAIDRPVIDVAVRNNELPISDDKEKTERLDVNCTIDGGDQVDVEMHGSRSEEVDDIHTNFFNKYVYYLTDLHSSQKSKGIPYYKMVRTYQVTFCNYTIYPNHPDFITRASLRRPDGYEVSNQINFILFELSKLDELLKKSPGELSALEQWCIFLHFAADAKRRDVVNKVIAERKEIAMAGQLLMEISQDERERAKFRSRRMYETDMISDRLTAEARGAMKVARNFKELGASPEMIAKATGLTLSEVEKL